MKDLKMKSMPLGKTIVGKVKMEKSHFWRKPSDAKRIVMTKKVWHGGK